MIRMLVFCGLLLGAVGDAAAETYLVQPDGTGDYPTIQSAVNAATHGDVIELANGIFTGDGNRDIDFEGRKLIVQSASGNPDSCVIRCDGSETEPHRAFYIHTFEDSTALISSITMKGGYEFQGGAILCLGSSPTITNCVFYQNTAIDDGGGVCCFDASSPTFRDCKFVANQSGERGGGVICMLGIPSFYDCEFRSNEASDGGGLYVSHVQPAIIEDCAWIENIAYSVGGGGLLFRDGHLALTRGEFRGNACQGPGGGLYLHDCSASIDHSLFIDNVASGRGGGLDIQTAASAYISHCTFLDNWTNAGGGAIGVSDGCSLEIVECTIASNFSRYGGGIYSHSQSCSITNTIIAFNHLSEGIFCDLLGTPTLTCCDVYGNEDGDWVGFISNQYGINGNFSSDPYFCDIDNDDYHLWNYSQCNQSTCGIIGAWPVGCWDLQAADDYLHESTVLVGLNLAPSAPNPFRTSTRITYYTPPIVGAGESVLLTVHDVTGRLVRTLVDASQSPGRHEVLWDGSSDTGEPAARGAYFVQLCQDGETETRRVLLVR
jgi:FlgD Ig-like domain